MVLTSQRLLGSLRFGQYAVLELEKQAIDDSWVVRSASFRQLPQGSEIYDG
jgi:hypothetical protein